MPTKLNADYILNHYSNTCKDTICLQKIFDEKEQQLEEFRAEKEALEKKLAMFEATRQRVISGVLYDLFGWLTTRRTTITMSDKHDAGIAADTLIDFAKMRGLSLDEPLIESWQCVRDGAEELTKREAAARQQGFEEGKRSMAEELNSVKAALHFTQETVTQATDAAFIRGKQAVLARLMEEIEQLHGALDAKITICGDAELTAEREKVRVLREAHRRIVEEDIGLSKCVAISYKALSATAPLDTTAQSPTPPASPIPAT